MRTLVVLAHPASDSLTAELCQTAIGALHRSGHDVTVIDLYSDSFVAQMSRDERLAYESDSPILDPLVARYAQQLKHAEALVFVYPTWYWSHPAILKGWLERVFVPGVGWSLDPNTNKPVGGLSNVRRIVGISTYGPSRLETWAMVDSGRRLIKRNVRFLAPKFRCRSTWLGLYGVDRRSPAEVASFVARVDRKMASL